MRTLRAFTVYVTFVFFIVFLLIALLKATGTYKLAQKRLKEKKEFYISFFEGFKYAFKNPSLSRFKKVFLGKQEGFNQSMWEIRYAHLIGGKEGLYAFSGYNIYKWSALEQSFKQIFSIRDFSVLSIKPSPFTSGCVDADGVFFATLSGSVIAYRDGVWQYMFSVNFNGTYFDFLAKYGNYIYIGANRGNKRGIWKFDMRSRELERIYRGSILDLTCNGEEILFAGLSGGYDYGILRLETQELVVSVPRKYGYIRKVLINRKGNLVLGFPDAIVEVKRDHSLDERFYKEGFNMNLKDIGELPDGRLIVATWGLGLLAEVERGVWKKYGLLEGFESNEVNSILVDKDGYVWVGADKLLRINYIELLKDILSYGKPL